MVCAAVPEFIEVETDKLIGFLPWLRRCACTRRGGPEVLTFEEVDVPAPGQGRSGSSSARAGSTSSTRISDGHVPRTGIAVHRRQRGAGDVVAVGPESPTSRSANRVAYVSALGSYAAERLMPAERCVPLPSSISYEQAAGMMLKGMTAQYLLRQTFRVEAGQNHPRPCRSRRGRPDPVSVGQATLEPP